MFDQQSTTREDLVDDSTTPPQRKPTRKQRRAAKREYDAARYQARLAGPLCLRCDEPKAADSSYCVEHAESVLVAARANAKQRRRRLVAAGCCGECGVPKDKRKTVVPLPSLASPAQWHTEGRKVQVRQVTEGDGRTRQRYAGQARRGRMGRASEDEQDMRDAQAELEAANRALAQAHSPDVKALGPLSARAVLMAALDRVALAQRFLMQILQRHKYGG